MFKKVVRICFNIYIYISISFSFTVIDDLLQALLAFNAELSFGNIIIALGLLSPYVGGLYRKLSRKKQQKMKKKLESQMVIHYRSSTGVKKV